MIQASPCASEVDNQGGIMSIVSHDVLALGLTGLTFLMPHIILE